MLMKLMMENPSMLKEISEKLQTGTGNSSKSRSSRSPSSPSKSADQSSRKYKSPTRNVIAHGDSIKVNVGRNNSPASGPEVHRRTGSRSSASRKVISTESSSSSSRKVIPQSSSTSTGDSKFSNRTRSRSRSRSNSRDHESSKRSIKDRLGPVNQEKSSSSSFKQDHWNGKSKSGKAERNGRDSKRET